MEGLRGFAALLVFFVHFHSIFEKYVPDERISAPIRFMASIGHVGVDLFFVLSGFLVYGIVMRSGFRFTPYFSRRIQRLYPVFVVVLGIYILLSYLFPDHSKLPSNATNLIPYILANIAMLPGMIRITPIITVSWSLSYEWFFYLILPIAFAALGMRKWKFKWRIAFWIALVSAYWLAFSFGLIPHPRLLLFVSGILVWEVKANTYLISRLASWGETITSFAFIGVLIFIWMSRSSTQSTSLILLKIPRLYVPLLFVSILFLVCYGLFKKGFLGAIFSWTPLRWVGNMSYSYYLIHGLALHGLNLMLIAIFGEMQFNWFLLSIVLLASLASTLLAGSILYLTIERPLSINTGRT